jgi:HAD superfamily hydrolase (TIGR01509 family)
MGKISAVLFDWDGTLLDSAVLGFHAFQHTFSDLEIEFHAELYESIYSPNWYTMYETLGLPKDKWEMADALWLQHYGEESPCLVDGARGMLLALCRRGYRLGLVSSGSCCRVRREVESVGLDFVFQTVICNEDIVNKKPHPEGLERAIAHMGTTASSSCYVGDSPEDIEMGKNASVITVGIRGPYPGSRRLPEANPDLCLDSLTSLLHHL